VRFIDLIRYQTAENGEIRKQHDLHSTLADSSAEMHFYYSLNGQLHSLITGVSGIVILVVGGMAIIQRQMTIGEFFAFYFATGFLYRNIATITDTCMQIVAGNESLKTLMLVMQTEQLEPRFGDQRIAFQGHIQLKAVSFSYEGTVIFDEIDLCLRPGNITVIVGDNGSGKTTLINLIMGFHAAQSGQLEAEGVAYTDLDIRHLRTFIGIVSQDPLLFSGTILENITYGMTDIDDVHLKEVCRYSMVQDFAEELPQGYATNIGEEGSRLSGGQRQKLAIARAMLRRPKLLIFDEPTNHLDQLSVHTFIESLEGMHEKPAVLIVSHDHEVIRHAETIYTIEKKRLVPFHCTAQEAI
jgi:ABC-type bacteriocin/lantibiotic exporter with double-glycine peptidase domain